MADFGYFCGSNLWNKDIPDGRPIDWEFTGYNWEEHVEVDAKYIRPTEVDALIGDPSKIAKELNWKAKVHWKELAELMVDADVALHRN
jgi:GDP-D-mannose dehydratase